MHDGLDQLSHASREILADYTIGSEEYAHSNRQHAKTPPLSTSFNPLTTAFTSVVTSGPHFIPVNSFVKQRGAPNLTLSASLTDLPPGTKVLDFVPLGGNGAYNNQQQSHTIIRPQSAAASSSAPTHLLGSGPTALKRKPRINVNAYNAHNQSATGFDSVNFSTNSMNFPLHTGGKSFLDNNTHEGWKQLQGMRRREKGLDLLHSSNHQPSHNVSLAQSSLASGFELENSLGASLLLSREHSPTQLPAAKPHDFSSIAALRQITANGGGERRGHHHTGNIRNSFGDLTTENSLVLSEEQGRGDVHHADPQVDSVSNGLQIHQSFLSVMNDSIYTTLEDAHYHPQAGGDELLSNIHKSCDQLRRLLAGLHA
jgi:hypothetical protein